MSRIASTFHELRDKDEAAFIPFTELGDPNFERSQEVLRILARHGDLLELGFPFSDPIADGPRIQAAIQRALRSGITPDDCFELLSGLHEEVPDIPLCLLIYYNLIYARGTETFIKDAKRSGVDGLLVADMPVEEADPVSEQCEKHDLDQVFIVAPTTSPDRMRSILEHVSGFVYTVAVVGVTGERDRTRQRTLDLIRTIREESDLPVCVGFGISRPEHVREMVEAGADGVIVGSALESIIEEHHDQPERMCSKLDEFAGSLKQATIH
jgi:tryptophan synthase alpha chain